MNGLRQQWQPELLMTRSSLVTTESSRSRRIRVEVRPVASRQEFRQFLSLPHRLHRDHAAWVPPLFSEDRRLFDPAENRAFSYCDVRLALAWQDRTAVGRIAGIVNRASNRLRSESVARFGFLECTGDREVANALLDHVETWALGQAATRLVGPMGFTDQDPEGLWGGFDHEPALESCASFSFLARLLEQKGYSKEVDYIVYRVRVPAGDPPEYDRISRRIARAGVYRLVPVVRRREVWRLARPIVELMNDTFRDLYGFVPLDSAAIADLVNRYVPVVDPRFLKVVERDGAIAAFLVAIPNMDPGFRKAKGRLFPFGAFWIRRAARMSRKLDVLIAGVREQDRGRGLDALMGLDLLRSARQAEVEWLEGLVLEDNARARREIERLRGQESKRYRIYRKTL
jgi:hypothetical protein